jgi:histidyl-tRNA synthetase
MASRNQRFQAPRGTRDFAPAEMATRRHIEAAWRHASVVHGFDEIEGPTFEHVELYTAKSGPGIVSELFSFTRAGGDTAYALRAEFTPTVARMVAALGSAAPRPIKWFGVPCLFRAERPQRGRLREHVQWNVDVMGEPGPAAEAEVIATAVTALRQLGLSPDEVAFRVSHRGLAIALLRDRCGVTEEHLDAALQLLDRREKVPADVFAEQAAAIGMDPSGLSLLDRFADARIPLADVRAGAGAILPDDAAAAATLEADPGFATIRELAERLDEAGCLDWCRLDLSIVRGLAYYTGTVFELHETGGRERAVAGGGRYDGLVELFGGPPTPAVGFGMGDVVLGLVLGDRGRLPAGETLLPRPDCFVLGDDETVGPRKARLLARLREAGIHARRSYKATTKVRKWLEEAGKARARFAVILDADRPDTCAVKDLDSGTQTDVPDTELVAVLRGAAPGPPDGS